MVFRNRDTLLLFAVATGSSGLCGGLPPAVPPMPCSGSRTDIVLELSNNPLHHHHHAFHPSSLFFSHVPMIRGAPSCGSFALCSTFPAFFSAMLRCLRRCQMRTTFFLSFLYLSLHHHSAAARMGSRRKKRRTHVPATAESIAAIPKSFVIKAGGSQVHSASLGQLVKDVRRVMEPNTASKIRERKGNKLKDFVHVASMLNVSHLIMFSTSESASGAKIGLRVGRMPRGPTLYFSVREYVLTRDVQAAQARPKSPGSDFKTSPLVVLNNFNDPANHVKLMATMFQNLFPAINVQTMKLNDARRIVLFSLDSETGTIDMRHFSIGVKQIGLSKSVKTILHSSIPDLNKFEDVSDYVLKSAFASESDVEDGPESTVTLPQKYTGRNNAQNTQRAVKLVELGPRMKLKLVKITEGLCGGEVLHHAYVQKSAEEVNALKKKVLEKEKEKAKRRAEQEKNVERKKKGLVGDQEEVSDDDDEPGADGKKRKRVTIEADDDGDDGDDEFGNEDDEYEFDEGHEEDNDEEGGQEGEEDEEEEGEEEGDQD